MFGLRHDEVWLIVLSPLIVGLAGFLWMRDLGGIAGGATAGAFVGPIIVIYLRAKRAEGSD